MPRILLIDDERDIRLVMTLILNELGHEVIEAPSGEDGLQKAASDNPDLILLDLTMPGMSGIEVLSAIRFGPSPDAPVILMTGSTEDDQLQQARDLGIQAQIRKPWEFEDVVEAINTALSSTLNP